jgi:solute carrier family 25 phosphate transporter 23/24/25/41
MYLVESQDERDIRVDDLWRHLDPKQTGEIDLKGLERGLKKLNHRQPPAIFLSCIR